MYKNIWQRNWVWMTAVAIGLLGALAAAGMEQVNAGKIQQGIAGEIIRFHVLANSDSEADQNLKLKVKTVVVEALAEILADADSAAASRQLIQENLAAIQQLAAAEVAKNGCRDEVTAALTEAYFPTVSYGDCTFPEGRYEALQIKIGTAAGHNWWCVLYPGLCFTDAVGGVVTEDKLEVLEQVLTAEEYESILHGGKVKVSFRWLKW